MAKRISQSFLINREENYRAMMQFLVNRNPEIEWEVVIREYKSDRSLDQNRLLWKWHQEWAEQAGYTKEYAHNRFKYKYVLPILLRDDEDGQITRVWELVRNDKEAIAGLVKAIHSSDLTVSQMHEALTDYQMAETGNGYTFTDPELKAA